MRRIYDCNVQAWNDLLHSIIQLMRTRREPGLIETCIGQSRRDDPLLPLRPSQTVNGDPTIAIAAGTWKRS